MINILSLLLIVVVVANQSGAAWLYPARVVLGLPYILFLPGYALIGTLFPGRTALDGIERVALSFGVSIAVVPLIGLGLNYTPWGIRLTPILVSLTVFTFVLSGIAFWRRAKTNEPYYPVFRFTMPRWSDMGRLDRLLTLVLVLAVFFAAASIVYVVNTSKAGEKFTEFYILGPGGKAADYPHNLVPGQKAQVIVGVVNHEYAPVTYWAEVTAGGYTKEKTAPFQLSNGQTWEQPMSFAIDKPYTNLQVQFVLFRWGDNTPYRSLHLWVTVANPQEMPATHVGPEAAARKFVVHSSPGLPAKRRTSTSRSVYH